MSTISAVDLYNYTTCAHRVYLDANGDPDLKSPVSKFIEMLWFKGLQVEQEFIQELGYENYDDLQSYTTRDAADKTTELMEQGVPMIYQGALIQGNRVGRPDLLIRHDDGESKFGSYYYEPVDIKAGRGWEERNGERTTFKKHYAYQVLFYHDLIKDIQGEAPKTCRIVNVDGEYEDFEREPFQGSFMLAMMEVEALIEARETSEPVLGSHCSQCPWFSKCKRWVDDTHDPTGLFFVGKQKFGLKDVGLKTVEDISRIHVPDYLKPPNKIPRMGEKSLSRMKRRALVMMSGEPQIRPGYTFPDATSEIYFDIEDDPTQDVTYLFGMWIRKRGSKQGKFEYILAETPEDEENACNRFWNFMAAQKDEVYYVYSHKERSSLRRLMEKYDLSEEVFNKYVAREYDQYKDLIVEFSDWPTYSYGIKQIAKQVGFKWRDTDPGGANSIAWYNDYLEASGEDKAKLLNRILEYNEDDCIAMAHIKDWFQARMIQD